MLEADLRRCGQRIHGLAGRDAQLRPPEIADELQDPLVHLSSGGERHLPLLPQTPPPGRAARYPHVRCHHVDGCRRGERHLPLLPQTPPPGRAARHPHVRCHHVDGCHRGERHLPLLPQTPPPGRVACYPHVRCHHVDGCHRGERHLPLLPQTPPGRAPRYPHVRWPPVDGCRRGERHLPLLPQTPARVPRVGRHREKVTQEDLKTSSPLSRVMGHSRPSSRRRSPWKDPGAMKCVILSFQPSSPAGASSSRSTSCVTSGTSPTRWSTRTGPSEQRSPSTTL